MLRLDELSFGNPSILVELLGGRWHQFLMPVCHFSTVCSTTSSSGILLFILLFLFSVIGLVVREWSCVVVLTACPIKLCSGVEILVERIATVNGLRFVFGFCLFRWTHVLFLYICHYLTIVSILFLILSLCFSNRTIILRLICSMFTVLQYVHERL